MMPSRVFRSTNSGDGPRPRARAPANGYVLLFALGLIVVVSTLVLSLTVSLRLDAQLLAREKIALQEEYLMRGAAQYAAAQLGITAAVDALQLDPKTDLVRQWRLWRPSTEGYEITLGAAKLRVTLADVSDLPDANLLSVQQWGRLLQQTGLKSEEAMRLAEEIVAVRQELAHSRRTAGFSGLDELMHWDQIPRSVSRFVVVGTKRIEVNLNSTPEQVLRFLGDVSPDKLQQLAKLRKDGVIPPAQAQAWLQGTGLRERRGANSVLAATARIRMLSSAPENRSWTALISGENGIYTVIDQPQAMGLSLQ